MPKLKRLATLNHVYLDEDMGTEFSLCAEDGWSWENGATQTLVYSYGSEGSYEPEHRQQVIKDAIQDLEGNHAPEPIPYTEAA